MNSCPALTHPALTRPALTRPTLTRPALARPIAALYPTVPNTVGSCHQKRFITTEPGKTSIAAIRTRQEEQANNAADSLAAKLLLTEEFYYLPVIMIHCQWSDTAVSVHNYDKLDELDAVYSIFANDVGAYGLRNRTRDEVTEELVVKALGFMARRKWFKARVVVKGWNGQLTPACDILDKADMFDFVSITEMSRRLGEENPVYQRPVTAYPSKVKMSDKMEEGPDTVPKTKLDQFTRLNVNWKDVAAFGYTTPNFIQKGRSKSGPEKEVDRPAGKSGFKKKKGGKMPGAPDISNVQGIKINLDKL